MSVLAPMLRSNYHALYWTLSAKRGLDVGGRTRTYSSEFASCLRSTSWLYQHQTSVFNAKIAPASAKPTVGICSASAAYLRFLDAKLRPTCPKTRYRCGLFQEKVRFLKYIRSTSAPTFCSLMRPTARYEKHGPDKHYPKQSIFQFFHNTLLI
mgnify:CR=1 FL=1